MLDANVENSLDGAFKIGPGASFSGKRELTGLRISGYDISDFSEGFGNGSARRIDEELLASGAMEEISGTELGGFSKYLPEGNGKVYLLKKPLRLAGVGRGAGGSVPPDSNSYEIGGSVVSYPEITKGVTADIECDGCELAVDGAMLMISVERYAGYRFSSLAYNFKSREMEPMIVTMTEKDGKPDLVSHEGQEFNYVISGTIGVTINGREFILNEGDSIYFNPVLPHGQRAIGGEGRFLTVINERMKGKK